MNLATHRALAVAAAVVAAATLSACGERDEGSMGGPTGMGMPSRTVTSPGTPSGQASATPTSATSTSPAADTTAAGPHNQADIDFAAGMVPHHAQALVMADMALAHGTTDDFRALAKAIKAAQKPEIDQMSGWLVAWGQEVPGTSGHAGHDGTGMMNQQDLDDLSQMRGSGFEGMWLTMMIEHHEGAIEMAQTELKQGSSSAAKTLAGAIVKAQSSEIAQMRTMVAERAN